MKIEKHDTSVLNPQYIKTVLKFDFLEQKDYLIICRMFLNRRKYIRDHMVNVNKKGVIIDN